MPPLLLWWLRCYLKDSQVRTHKYIYCAEEAAGSVYQSVCVCLYVYTAVPLSPLGDERLISCTVGKALFLSVILVTVLGCALSVMMWMKKKRKGKRDPLQRGCVAQGKHPNVVRSLMTLISVHI